MNAPESPAAADKTTMSSLETAVPGTRASDRMAWARRPASAGLVLLLAYFALSIVVDPLVGLSTDTGGKTATVEAMVERGDLGIDVGYWAAEHDPDGSVHPMWFTVHTDDGDWLQVTTLPMIYAARPLWALGGARLALLLPMLGAVAAAFAARAIARRCSSDDGWAAYWLVGLAGPVLVYALDFWEHTIGLALMAWGVVAAHDALTGERIERLGLAGLAFGAAATMRTEALVYGVVIIGFTCVWAMLRSRVTLAIAGGVAALVGAGVPLFANNLLENAVIGSSFRSDRATGATSRLGADASLRLKEAILTFTGIVPGFDLTRLVLGVAFLVALVLLVRAAISGDERRVRLLAAVALAWYAMRALDGLGFVPGLVAATPLAAAALAGGWRLPSSRYFVLAAVVPLPLVWATQYTGGAGPQWAGRYILTTGLVLMVVGWVVVSTLDARTQKVFVALSVAITLFGYSWLVQRTNQMADAFEQLAAREEPVLIWGDAFLAREAGELNLTERWLTAIDEEHRAEAATVVAAAGFDEFAYVKVSSTPPEFPGWVVGDSDRVELLSGIPLTVTTYVRPPG